MAELSWPLVPETTPAAASTAPAAAGVAGFRDFLQDENGDIALVGGDFVAVTGVESIRQHLRMRLRFFKEEWFLDRDAGLPYVQQILGQKNPNLTSLSSLFRNEIAGTPGITSVERVAITPRASRRYSVDFSARANEQTLNETVVL